MSTWKILGHSQWTLNGLQLAFNILNGMGSTCTRTVFCLNSSAVYEWWVVTWNWFWVSLRVVSCWVVLWGFLHARCVLSLPCSQAVRWCWVSEQCCVPCNLTLLVRRRLTRTFTKCESVSGAVTGFQLEVPECWIVYGRSGVSYWVLIKRAVWWLVWTEACKHCLVLKGVRLCAVWVVAVLAVMSWQSLSVGVGFVLIPCACYRR